MMQIVGLQVGAPGVGLKGQVYIQPPTGVLGDPRGAYRMSGWKQVDRRQNSTGHGHIGWRDGLEKRQRRDAKAGVA